jgi:hypothetical protein
MCPASLTIRQKTQQMGFSTDAAFGLDRDHRFMDGTALMDVTAAAGAAWVMVRMGAAKGVLRVKAPARCAACGRQRVWGRCPCTDDQGRLR